MLQAQLVAATAAARTTTVLDALARAIWSGLAGGHLTEEQAQEAAKAVEGRREGMRAPKLDLPARGLRNASAGPFRSTGATFFARARVQRPPDRAASLARRRLLAASGPMPPQLAAHFTTGELAVLRIMADEVVVKGCCDRTYAELAARGGVGRTTAKNA